MFILIQNSLKHFSSQMAIKFKKCFEKLAMVVEVLEEEHHGELGSCCYVTLWLISDFGFD